MVMKDRKILIVVVRAKVVIPIICSFDIDDRCSWIHIIFIENRIL